MYSEHQFDDVLRIIFLPEHDLFLFDVDTDYFAWEAILLIDRSYVITHMSCSCQNHWPEINGDSPDTSSGGGDLLRDLLRAFGGLPLLRIAAEAMLGPERQLELSPEANESDVPAELQAIARRAFDDLWYDRGPWNRTIGLFQADYYHEMASRIQAVFRGWRTRLSLRYDPSNRLGRYVVTVGSLGMPLRRSNEGMHINKKYGTEAQSKHQIGYVA
jgi:hypothetical protein